jgi:hypothetical protein
MFILINILPEGNAFSSAVEPPNLLWDNNNPE